MSKIKHLTKKAQAAMEFLMTYGWAIITVLIAIGAIAYFGVLEPQKFLPRKCVIQPGIYCRDFKVNEDSVTLLLKNAQGKTMTITNLRVEHCSGTASGSLRDDEQANFTIDGCNNIANEKFAGDLNITYYLEPSGLSRVKTGNILSRVEKGYAVILFSDYIEENPPVGRFGLYYPPPDAYPNWTVVQGNWIIENGYLKNLWGPDMIRLDAASSETGRAIRAKVLENYHAIYPKFILGYQDLNNYYSLTFSWGYGWGGSLGWIRIDKVVDGQSTTLAQADTTVQLVQGQWYWMEFRWLSPTKLEGELWDLDWNTLATVEADISEGWTTGNFALGSYRGTSHAWFDNIQIRRI